MIAAVLCVLGILGMALVLVRDLRRGVEPERFERAVDYSLADGHWLNYHDHRRGGFR
jgi:hypothetical protein